MPQSEHFIEIINTYDLAERWKSDNHVFPMPVFQKGQQSHILHIEEPAELYYKNNPNGGGIAAHIKFRFHKSLDGDDDKWTRFFMLNDSLSFIFNIGSERYVVHNEYGYSASIDVRSSPYSEYVSVHVIESPLSYKDTKLAKE